MGSVDELLARHRAAHDVAARSDERPEWVATDPLSGRPRLRLAVVTCMDVRIDPQRVLGLRSGDAHVIRNAGGLVTDDVLRSLVLSQQLASSSEIMLMQHTDCALHQLRDDDLMGRLVAETQEEPPFAPGGFRDVDESVRAGMARIRSVPWVEAEEEQVRGFVYDVATGEVREVVS